MEDWLKLRSDYFEPVARDVFDHYLRQHGFGNGEADETGCLTYHRREVFVRVYYYVEDSPKYAPMVSIGLDLKSVLVLAVEQIGVWYAVPLTAEERNYETWTFSDADELRGVLSRIRDQIVDVYARPLWEDPDRLASLIDQRNQEYKIERAAEVVNRRKQDAEHAFRAHDYEKAAQLYGSINEADLSTADREAWHKVLQWPAGLEEQWQKSRTDKKSEESGLKFFELSPGNYLVAIEVHESAYQPRSVFMYYSETRPKINKPGRLLKLKTYERDDDAAGTVSSKVTTEVEGIVSFGFTKELILYTKGRGTLDCGALVRYRILPNRIVPTEARAHGCYDDYSLGEVNPFRWKKITRL